MEGHCRRVRCIVNTVCWRSVHAEIAGIESIRIHWVGHIDREVSRLSEYHAVTCWVSAGNHQEHPDWLLVEEGILLRLAIDAHAPIHPCMQVLSEHRGGVV